MKRFFSLWTVLYKVAPVASLCTCFTPVNAYALNEYRFGVEGFQDHYTEDSVDLSEHSHYGSVTADYIHSANGYFTAIQTRGSYGKDNYKSSSGIINGIPQYEGEVRVLTGISIPIPEIGGVNAVVPFVGLGTRFFYDNSKNEVTNTGLFGYDRRIVQFYVPIGAKWEFTHGPITFWPTAEFDPMFYGYVNSRFRNFDPASKNLENKQTSGYGLRGEIMAGQKLDGYSWQIGPFFRYWRVKDSNLDYNNSGNANAGYYLEPKNSRLQTGAALRVQF